MTTSSAIPTVHGMIPAAGPARLRMLFLPHLVAVSVGLLLLLVSNGLTLLLPRLVSEAVDHIGGTASHASVLRAIGSPAPTITTLGAALIGLALVGAVMRVASRVVLFNIGRDIERELRSQLFGHLSALSPPAFAGRSTGDLMSRMTNDLGAVRLMAGFALLNALNASIIFLSTLPLLFALDFKVACLALLPFPLVMGVTRVLSRQMYRRTLENQQALGALTAALQENLAGQSVVRAFAREQDEIERFNQVNQRAYDAAMRLAWIRLILFPLTGLMTSLAIAIALYAGGQAVVSGRMSVGDVVEFNARLLQLSWPAVALGFIISVFQRGRASMERINEVFSERPEVVDGPDDKPLGGALALRGLTITPPGAVAPTLAGVDVTLAAGDVLGIVGKSGSGKSTLIRALTRHAAVGPGMLFFDHRDVVSLNLSTLRRGVAVVPDDGFLFSASLRENLVFARSETSEADVLHAAATADLSRDLAALPEGLDTAVGERGVTLSGGQRQRVALARALLARAPILVLDDCLSAVDAETESRIVSALRRGEFGSAGRPPTTIVVSHRLSAVKDADEILVLDEGRVVERGRHEALLGQDGLYARLWGEERLRAALDAPVETTP